ncbi:hypothetical protein [Pseudomonas mosselii]|uniref:hypothetical protein n=1 Tax=Pseudomonas mosselii TaxID=78327 RepID=UPI00164533BA|nr:hypothetical protein [Pseudomonas mosselii]MBC3456316.1 hypothetical protein [Pseudomonas mosselii]
MDSPDKPCPFCAETIKAEAIRCKHCQADLLQPAVPPEPKQQPQNGMGGFAKAMIGILVVVIAFFSFGAYKAGTPEGREKSRARQAIEICRDRESTYRGSDGAREIISGACEKLESDFRAKFGVSP